MDVLKVNTPTCTCTISSFPEFALLCHLNVPIKRGTVAVQSLLSIMARDVPVELWRRIFNFAVGAGLETEFDSFVEIGRWERNYYQLTNYTQTMTTKLALVLVCKRWNAIASALLYQYLRPTSIPKLKVLTQSFSEGGDWHDRGRWVVRLDIPIEEGTVGGSKRIEDILAILPLVRNLRILIIHGWILTRDGHDAIVRELVNLPSVELLHVYHWDGIGDGSYSAPYLNLAHLRTFSGGWGFRTPRQHGLTPALTVTVHGQHLTTLLLKLGYTADFPLANMDFPSLTALGLSGNNSAEELGEIDGLLRFLDRHGPRLTSLGFDQLTPASSMLQVEKELLNRCTCLTEVVYFSMLRREYHLPQVQRPSVRSVGFYLSHLQDRVRLRFMNQVGMDLEDPYGLLQFPGIQAVRIVDLAFGSMSPAVQAAFVTAPRRFVLEDGEGMKVPPSQLLV